MTVIRDPETQRGVKVNEEGELITRAIAEPEIEHASSLGNAYAWFSPTQDVVAGGTLLFIKNLGDTPLILDRMRVIGGNVASTYTIHLGKLTTAPDTINITGTNLNQRFGDEADVHATTNETALADGTTVEIFQQPATISQEYNLAGIILTKGVYIQINQETESTAGAVVIYGHFENPA